MSKGNLFLGMARGKVGDVVFTRNNGEQVTRARNRAPKNPRSPLQVLQRVVMNTSAKAYSVMQEICDHSFEGYGKGTPCQSEFMRLNVDQLRSSLAYEIAFPFEDVMMASIVSNFNQKGDNNAELNPYVVSRGSLPSMLCAAGDSNNTFILEFASPLQGESPTYDDVIEALGLQRGDQLTFLGVTYSSRVTRPREFITEFKYARIILEPSSGDFTTPFLSGTAPNLSVGSPNAKNEGIVRFSNITSASLTVSGVNPVGASDQALGLGTVIASRYSNGRWLRSSQSLVWAVIGQSQPNADLFSDAWLSYQEGASSSLYLNQAE